MLTADLLDGIGWKTNSAACAPEAKKRRPFFPRIKHAVKLIPTLARLLIFIVREWWNGRGAFIDLFRQMRHYPYTGVPMGGIGCGSIGTDYRGGFGKMSIVPGFKEQHQRHIKANQFILTVRQPEQSVVYQTLLSCANFKRTELNAWKSRIRSEDMRYRGLFPLAYREFRVPELDLTVFMEQMSPVIPHNYEDSSLPATLFSFTVYNNSTVDYQVSISFTWRNGTGNPKWEKESTCLAESFDSNDSSGMSLQHTIKGMPCTYAIAVEKDIENTVSRQTFGPTGDGKEIWEALKNNSDTDVNEDLNNVPELAVAVTTSMNVGNGSSRDATFSLIWHMPQIEFGKGQRTYKRWYAQFFNPLTAVENLTQRCFTKKDDWRREIAKWHAKYTKDQTIPEWYRSAIINELYYVVDGSTSWVQHDAEKIEKKEEMSHFTKDWQQKHGRFIYLESWEYYMFNTYDVHFYASWALLKNWPMLEMSMQLDFCDQVFRTDKKLERNMCEGDIMEIKKYGKIPHDLGHPAGDPWLETNAYLLHDTSHWKDLNMKFVLLCWRDWKQIYDKTEDKKTSIDLLHFLHKRCSDIIERALAEWDSDGDGMIENEGTADQTYDIWKMTGTSAYCGSLWLCALSCLIEMCSELGKDEEKRKYEQLLERATEAFNEKLWNGRFFQFDENSPDTIMADQLCGVWFNQMIGGKELVEHEKINTALNTIYEKNFMSFNNGQLGPVNGMMLNGKVDLSSIQSEEVWSGICYAVASFFIIQGDAARGFATTEGLFTSCWNKFGLQWQTPEAIFRKKYYRAIGYMRALAIWAMQEAIERRE